VHIACPIILFLKKKNFPTTSFPNFSTGRGSIYSIAEGLIALAIILEREKKIGNGIFSPASDLDY
jgi:hypothetical protein